MPTITVRPPGLLQAGVDQGVPLGVEDGGGLAGGTQHHQAVGAAGHHVAHQAPEGGEVDGGSRG